MLRPQRINDKNNNGNNNNEDDKDDRIMVTISIVGLYAAGTVVAGRAKVEGLFSRGKMPVLGKERGETGWRGEWDGRAREKSWRKEEKDGGEGAKVREKGSWFKRKQGTGNTEKVKEIYEVGEQNGRRTWARY